MERYFSHNPFASPEHTHTTRAKVSCLKVVNYTDSRCNNVEECSLPDDEGILNFVNGQGQFAPKEVPDGVTIKGQVRCLIPDYTNLNCPSRHSQTKLKTYGSYRQIPTKS